MNGMERCYDQMNEDELDFTAIFVATPHYFWLVDIINVLCYIFFWDFTFWFGYEYIREEELSALLPV